MATFISDVVQQLHNRRYDDALQLVEKRLQSPIEPSELVVLKLAQGEILYQQEDWMRASEAYMSALDACRKIDVPMQVRMQLVRRQLNSFLNMRMLDKASDLLTSENKEKQTTGVSVQLSAQLALFYLMNERYQDAVRLLGSIIEKSVKDKSILSEQFKEDLGIYKELIDDSHSYETFLIGIYNDTGICESKLGNHSKAVEYFQHAMKLVDSIESSTSTTLFDSQSAVPEDNTQNVKEPRLKANQKECVSKGHIDIDYSILPLNAFSGEPSQASKLKALTCYNMGKAELSLNKHKQAVAHFKEAIEYSPSFSRYIALGLTHLEMGDFHDAAEVITRALNMRTGVSSLCLGEVSYNLGVLISEELKQPYKALEFFDEATALFLASNFDAGAILSKIAKASSLTAITAIGSDWEFLVAFLNTLYLDLRTFSLEQGYNVESASSSGGTSSSPNIVPAEQANGKDTKGDDKDGEVSLNNGSKDKEKPKEKVKEGNKGKQRERQKLNRNVSTRKSSTISSVTNMQVLNTESIGFNFSEHLMAQKHLVVTRLQTTFNEKKNKYLAILYTNLGLIYYRLGISAYYQQARRCLEIAIWFDSECVYALNHFAILLLRENSKAMAIETLLKCTKIRPDYHEPFYNLGNILKADGETRKALQYYNKAVELNSRFVDGYLARGTLFAEMHRFEAAYHDFRKCVELNPNNNHAFCNYIHIKQILGIFANDSADMRKISCIVDDYINEYKIAQKAMNGNMNSLNLPLPPIMPCHCYLYRLSISQLRFICQRYSEQNVTWVKQHMDMPSLLPSDLSSHRNVPQNTQIIGPITPIPQVKILMFPTMQQNLMPLTTMPFIAAGAPIKSTVSFQTIKPYSREPHYVTQGVIFSYEGAVIMPLPDKCNSKDTSTILNALGLSAPLRIGILCDDTNSIPIGCILDSWLCFLDSNFISVSIYSTVSSDKSALRSSIEAHCKNFVDLTESRYQGNPFLCAQKINTDGICIMICMCQHNYCLEGKILAMRPAPIQISYWTHGGTTGSSYFDYILADQYCIPLGYAHLYSEHVITMPECFVCPSHSMHYAKVILPEEQADILKITVDEVKKLTQNLERGENSKNEDTVEMNILSFDGSDASSSTDSGVGDRVVSKPVGTSMNSEKITKAEKKNLLEMELEFAEIAKMKGVTKNEIALEADEKLEKKLLLNDRIFITGDNVFFKIKAIRNGRMVGGGDRSMIKRIAPLLKAVQHPQDSASKATASVPETKEAKASSTANNCVRLELPLYRRNIRALYGIPTDCFLFCTFSQVYKFDIGTLIIIITLLRRIPTAYYAILKFPPASQNHIASFFRYNAPDIFERVLFLNMLPIKVEHIRRYLAVDVFVDTAKCNGSTIVLDALWSGVPVVSFAGDYILNRKTVSFVSNLECQDLVCSSCQEMINLCVRLATEVDYYMNVRLKILKNRYKLFDIRRWCDNFTVTMVLSYRNWLSGGKPISFSTERVIANMRVQGFSWPLKDITKT